jgi:phage recombination protein Bet
MTTALAVNPDQKSWDQTQLAALRQIGLADAPAGDLALFLHYAQRTGLDPFSRQIYMIGRNSKGQTKYTIQSSIDGLRIIAQRSGEYAGQTAPMWCGADGVWKDVWLEPTPPVAAKIGVYRKGFVEALYGVARLDSYAPKYNGQLSGLWATMPDVMLAKVAESLALRKAFPNDLSGIYTSEEMDQADAKVNPPVVEQVPAVTVAPEVHEAEVVTTLTDAERTKLTKAIANAKTKADLRKIWNEQKDHLTELWWSADGEEVSLQGMILSRQTELPEE